MAFKISLYPLAKTHSLILRLYSVWLNFSVLKSYNAGTVESSIRRPEFNIVNPMAKDYARFYSDYDYA
jgi:hypothetical protein